MASISPNINRINLACGHQLGADLIEAVHEQAINIVGNLPDGQFATVEDDLGCGDGEAEVILHVIAAWRRTGAQRCILLATNPHKVTRSWMVESIMTGIFLI